MVNNIIHFLNIMSIRGALIIWMSKCSTKINNSDSVDDLSFEFLDLIPFGNYSFSVISNSEKEQSILFRIDILS